MASFLPAIISAIASIGGGYLAGRSKGGGETKNQKLSRNVAQDLIKSMRGEGPYSNLFQTDEAAFQKSIVDPSISRFRNQISPQIVQQSAGSGGFRGSYLDDQLARAGVDLNQMIDQNYLTFQNQGKDRMANALANIQGMSAGAPNQLTTGQAAGQATAGYLSSEGFEKAISEIVKQYSGNQQPQASSPMQAAYGTPKGFAPDWQDYKNWGVGDNQWGAY